MFLIHLYVKSHLYCQKTGSNHHGSQINKKRKITKIPLTKDNHLECVEYSLLEIRNPFKGKSINHGIKIQINKNKDFLCSCSMR